jgi:hypothetical protein
MAEEEKHYTTKELQHLFENLAMPTDPEDGNEIEATLELNIKATFILYQYSDQENGKSKRSFTVRFYHDDASDEDPAFPSSDYAAEIEDVTGADGHEREIGFDEIAGLLQIDPDKPLWNLEIEPES